MVNLKISQQKVCNTVFAFHITISKLSYTHIHTSIAERYGYI